MIQVNDSNVPEEVPAPEGMRAWPIFIVAESSIAEEDFSTKLSALLQAEGKWMDGWMEMDDMQALLTGPQPVSSSTESILRAVGDLLDKTAKPSMESGGYRRLLIYSGTVPTPAGEEQFDHWLEQSYLMVEESDGSPKDKRRIIMESLKGK